MSGKQLVETLKCLDYPGVESLDPNALDYMFENEEVVPVLELFCNYISQTNVLKKKDLTE